MLKHWLPKLFAKANLRYQPLFHITWGKNSQVRIFTTRETNNIIYSIYSINFTAFIMFTTGQVYWKSIKEILFWISTSVKIFLKMWTLFSCENSEKITESMIERAKRAPHWGVQSRFRVIYIYMLSVCRSMSVVCQINCVGGIGPRACSKSFLGG